MTTNLEKAFKSCGFSSIDSDLATDIDKILIWRDALQFVNVDGVEPMYSTLGDVEYIYNTDDPKEKDGDIFNNAPEVEDNFFVVPKVVVK